VTTKATDTTADATAKTADMTADMTTTTAAGAETSDVATANATAATPAKTTDVTAAKAPAASSATATTATAAGIGSDGDERHHEDQHRGNGDAGLQHRLRVTDQIQSCGRRLSRERMSAHPRTESS
jgi:hypothetical protein